MHPKTEILNDLELVDEYIEKCQRFIDPILLREVTTRGLYNIINFLPANIKEAKSVARGRLAKKGKYFGDDEIDQIANEIQRIEFLINKLSSLKATDVHKTLPLISEIQSRSEFVRDYFKH